MRLATLAEGGGPPVQIADIQRDAELARETQARLIEAGVGAGWWWATGAVIAASLAAVFYGGRLIERIYFRRAATAFEGHDDLWRLALAPALLAAILAIAIGLEPSLLLHAAERASALLLGEAT